MPLAGVDKETLILGVSLLTSLQPYGYSSAILDLHAKPDGFGVVTDHCFPSRYWHRVEAAGMGSIADLNFVSLSPSDPDFITDCYAKRVIKNATLAGVKKETLVLGISVSAYPRAQGYSTAILDYHADPKGDGVIKLSGGNIYFNSQKRATDKLLLAERFGLHGIYLGAGFFFFQDLLPWDKRSLFYALARRA
ncbi:hypothetical protein FOZ60_009525 [Perkinsus olseni]|uniref:Uncharacterized protein n=1 Tax=Perkinsus olseni TaxID=32597 RepID=A0A7J6NH10_PEROL|nr:hypothetical protein FOZ60_009525 [Perkinsus olseni]